MRKYLFLIILILSSHWALSDYLVVQRISNIKQTATSNGVVIEKAVKGDTLVLLEDQKQNGYYKVTAPTSGRPGFIYKNRVRRRPGDIPTNIVNQNTLVWDGDIPDGYYNSIDGLRGDSLKSTLNNIIQDHQEYPYTAASTDVWDILKETDRDIINPDHVVLIYSGRTRDAEGEYNGGNGWTREHVWAKSHGDFGTRKGPGTDVHALRPVDASVNSARNNKDFDFGGDEHLDNGFATGCFSDGDSWEPRNEVKGDVARMLFYMAVRYEGEDGEPDLELNNNTENSPDPFHGRFESLLEWHELDPVDAWERRRNDIIYGYQNNRNPFIDHPELVNRIWGDVN